MSYNQLFAIETCTQVNVREATRGQVIQRKPPCSGLQGHFCKNCCTRVFTSAIPRPWHQPFLSLSPAENGNYVAERDARPIWTKKDSRAKEPARPVERTELTPSRLLFVCEAQLQPRGTGTAISGTTPRTSRLPCTAPHAMSKCIFHPCRLCADSVILKVENSPYGKNDGDVCHSGLVTVIAEPWDNADGARTAYIAVSTCCESVTVEIRQTDEENFNWNYGELTNENRNLQRPRRS